MITFLWMLYLAITIYFTCWYVSFIIHSDKIDVDWTDDVKSILTCLLWSIWYFYYLH